MHLKINDNNPRHRTGRCGYTLYGNNMKKIITTLLFLVSLQCFSSEEDFAPITAFQLEAQTTENTFGKVLLSATLTRGQSGELFSSLVVEINGKKHSVPEDQLVRMTRVYRSTLTISSEVGYPNKGIGPYLYIRFDGHDGEPKKYLIIFDSSGFKELKTTDIQP